MLGNHPAHSPCAAAVPITDERNASKDHETACLQVLLRAICDEDRSFMDRVSVHLMEWLSIHLELYVCPLFRILLPSKGCWRTAARAAAVSPEPRPGMHLRRSPLD